jgi:hypothetical protein
MKSHISALSPKSQKVLAKKMDWVDLRVMANTHDAVVKGNCSLATYRLMERSMITKYGFTVN